MSGLDLSPCGSAMLQCQIFQTLWYCCLTFPSVCYLKCCPWGFRKQLHADCPQIFIRHRMQYQTSGCWQLPLYQALPLFGKVNWVYSSSHSLHRAGIEGQSASLDSLMVMREISQVMGSSGLEETFRIIQSNSPPSTTPKPHHPQPAPDTSKNGDSTVYLGNIFQCLTTQTVNFFF